MFNCVFVTEISTMNDTKYMKIIKLRIHISFETTTESLFKIFAEYKMWLLFIIF